MRAGDARSDYPRLTAALARYIAGPVVTAEDLADAAETIGDYQVWRAMTPADPVTVTMRRTIRAAVDERRRFAS